MRQLTLTGPKTLEWLTVPEPDLQDDGQALVRPLAVATCDLDQPMILGRAPFPTPIALGHECVAEVVAVGRGVRGSRVGDRVVVPFQVSCGTCTPCGRDLTGDCGRVDRFSMYGFGAFGGEGWGGFLSDLVRVPFADAMLVPVPPDVESEHVASASDNIADAWRLVAPHLARWPGEDVLIVGGAGSIGLYAVDLAPALGAGRVVYLDDHPARLAVASDLGAEVGAPDGPPPGRSAIVADFSGTADGLRLAVRATAPGGHCTHAAPIFGPDVPLPMLELYTSGITLHTSRAAARPAIPGILRLAAAGRIRPQLVTTEVVPFDEAATALLVPRTKTVLSRA